MTTTTTVTTVVSAMTHNSPMATPPAALSSRADRAAFIFNSPATSIVGDHRDGSLTVRIMFDASEHRRKGFTYLTAVLRDSDFAPHSYEVRYAILNTEDAMIGGSGSQHVRANAFERPLKNIGDAAMHVDVVARFLITLCF